MYFKYFEPIQDAVKEVGGLDVLTHVIVRMQRDVIQLRESASVNQDGLVLIAKNVRYFYVIILCQLYLFSDNRTCNLYITCWCTLAVQLCFALKIPANTSIVSIKKYLNTER